MCVSDVRQVTWYTSLISPLNTASALIHRHTHITMKNIIVHITHCCIAKVMYDIGLVEWHNNINVYCHILLCHV